MTILGGFTLFFMVLAVILALATITVRRKVGGYNYFILKCFASASFVFVALLGFLDSLVPKELAIFIVLGLVFGFLGDAVLGAKEIDLSTSKKAFVVAGIVAFLIGHILFSVGFIMHAGVNMWEFIIPAILAVVALIGFILLKYEVKGPMFILLTAYAFLETLVAAAAGYLMIKTQNPGHIVAFVGAVSFCVSDAILSYVYFGPNKNLKNFLVTGELTFYYLAQILISISLLFM